MDVVYWPYEDVCTDEARALDEVHGIDVEVILYEIEHGSESLGILEMISLKIPALIYLTDFVAAVAAISKGLPCGFVRYDDRGIWEIYHFDPAKGAEHGMTQVWSRSSTPVSKFRM